jgi:hypothetical protein
MRVRAGLVLATVGVLCAASAARADEQAELKALIDKAIKSVGGEEKLKKLSGMTLKGRGTVFADNQEVSFSVDGAARDLDRFRLDLEATVAGNTIKLLAVFQVDKVWAKVNEKTEEAPEEVATWMKCETHALRLAQTLLPLKGPDCTLTPMGEVAVGGKPAVGLKAAMKDRPDVNIYFDKESGLLVRVDLQVKDMPGMPEVTHEFLFSEPKELGGFKHFSKVVLNRDGKKLMEVELTELAADDKVDANLFEKP